MAFIKAKNEKENSSNDLKSLIRRPDVSSEDIKSATNRNIEARDALNKQRTVLGRMMHFLGGTYRPEEKALKILQRGMKDPNVPTNTKKNMIDVVVPMLNEKAELLQEKSGLLQEVSDRLA